MPVSTSASPPSTSIFANWTVPMPAASSASSSATVSQSKSAGAPPTIDFVCPQLSLSALKCREADAAGSGGRGGPVRLHEVEPVGFQVGGQEREQPRLRLEGNHSSAGADPVRAGQREVPPVRADVDEDVAGMQEPRRELRLLRLVAAGEADLSRHRVA